MTRLKWFPNWQWVPLISISCRRVSRIYLSQAWHCLHFVCSSFAKKSNCAQGLRLFSLPVFSSCRCALNRLIYFGMGCNFRSGIRIDFLSLSVFGWFFLRIPHCQKDLVKQGFSWQFQEFCMPESLFTLRPTLKNLVLHQNRLWLFQSFLPCWRLFWCHWQTNC